MMKGRTGLTPNILCRFGIILSAREPGAAVPSEYDSDGMEFNRYTLFGAHEAMIVAIMKERCLEDGLDPEIAMPEQMRAHINRGVVILYPRLRSVIDIVSLLDRPRTEQTVGALTR